MGRKWIPAVFLGLSLLLSACTVVETTGKEGIEPYKLTDQESRILEAFGMKDTSQILSFQAPREAITLNTRVYRLDEDGGWESIGGNQISIGKEREPVSQLSGTFAMELGKDYRIQFHVNCAGRVSFESDAVVLEQEPVGSTWGFLQEFQDIALNTEIPVAVMVYDSGTSMESCRPADYYEPEKFAGMDLVQAVTMEFTEEEI